MAENSTIPGPDYRYLQDLLRQRIANTLADDKQYLASARLTPVAREYGHADVTSLLRAARGGHRDLQDRIAEAMTINETSFFRDVHPFRALADHVIPELLRDGPRVLRMWSAAAATGQEAYSLALLTAEHFPTVPLPEILATDFSQAALQRARVGSYTQMEVNRGLPARTLIRYFTQVGRHWQIAPEIRRAVRFEHLNLSEPWPKLPAMHVILLRNVLLYLDDSTRGTVLQRAIDALAPGGYLLLGSAETQMLRSDRVERVELGNTICFRAHDGRK